MDGTSLNLEGQLLQFICPFIQTCRSLGSSHFHFFLGQAGQAWKMHKAETSKKNLLCRLNLSSMVESTGEGRGTAVKFLFSLFFFPIFHHPPWFFTFLPDKSLRGLFYLLLHLSASFPHVLKEGKHTAHTCHGHRGPGSQLVKLPEPWRYTNLPITRSKKNLQNSKKMWLKWKNGNGLTVLFKQ